MNSFAAVGAWAAIVLAALVTGALAPRWSGPAASVPRLVEGLLFAGAAAAVIAWCSNAGALIAAASPSVLLAEYVPIETAAGVRLAVLWATLPGAALTLATILLVWTVLSGAGVRTAFLTTGIACLALLVSVWFAPHESVTTTVPPFAQSGSAALAPLLALLSVVAIVIAVGTSGSSQRTALIAAWLAATGALACEQLARSQLGIGPRDAIVFGSASSGLILWLLTSALIHRRVQALLLRSGLPAAGRSSRAGMLAHVGAVLIGISFAAHALASRTTISLPPGSSVAVTDAFRGRWELVNQGVSQFDAEGVFVTALTVEARSPRGTTALLTPEIREYHGREGQHLEPVSLRKSVGRAGQVLRVLLVEADSLDVASVRVTFIPAPILWNLGLALLVLATVFALFAQPPRAAS